MKQPHLRKKTAMTDAEVSRLNRSRSVLSDTATYRKDNEDAILSRSNRSQSDMSGLPTKGIDDNDGVLSIAFRSFRIIHVRWREMHSVSFLVQS